MRFRFITYAYTSQRRVITHRPRYTTSLRSKTGPTQVARRSTSPLPGGSRRATTTERSGIVGTYSVFRQPPAAHEETQICFGIMRDDVENGGRIRAARKGRKGAPARSISPEGPRQGPPVPPCASIGVYVAGGSTTAAILLSKACVPKTPAWPPGHTLVAFSSAPIGRSPRQKKKPPPPPLPFPSPTGAREMEEGVHKPQLHSQSCAR